MVQSRMILSIPRSKNTLSLCDIYVRFETELQRDVPVNAINRIYLYKTLTQNLSEIFAFFVNHLLLNLIRL